jgi:hypothetical protein
MTKWKRRRSVRDVCVCSVGPATSTECDSAVRVVGSESVEAVIQEAASSGREGTAGRVIKIHDGMERSVDDSGRRAGYSLKPTTKSEHFQTAHVVSLAGCFAIPMSCETGFGSSSDPTADTWPIQRPFAGSLGASAPNAHDIINRLSAAVRGQLLRGWKDCGRMTAVGVCATRFGSSRPIYLDMSAV